MSQLRPQDNEGGTPSTFTPYLRADARLPELTVRAVLTGAVLGLLFGASSLYLVLKVGLTVSASIPVAVISIALYRLYAKAGGRDASILEHNIIQTGGSAGESIAFGLGVTMPAIMILGFDLEIGRVMLVAVLGGLLGILMMIPLRRALIVQQHGRLKYPEGTACAEVLKAGACEESRRAAVEAGTEGGKRTALSAHTIFTGFGIGLVYKTVMVALKGWKDIPGVVFGGAFKGGSLGMEVSPELLGVGYVIGPRIAAVLCAGGMFSYLLLIPLIKFFGEGLSEPLAPGSIPISRMTPTQVRQDYILYIGAGAVAAGGIISLLRSLPMLWHGLKSGLADLQAVGGAGGTVARTEQDLSMHFVVGGIVVLMLAILFSPSLHMNVLGALLIVVFGFLFVTVSSRLTGEIGSSSNPISGMTVATLLLTCLVFLLMGWTGGTYFVTALSVGAIVCIAASNGGTTSQDLKTGFLVGATPKHQQVAILVGALVSAVALGPILLKLNDAATVYVPASEVAPELRVAVKGLSEREGLKGPQARDDQRIYWVWHKTDGTNGPAGKYLVDDEGRAVYLVDPGVNGHYSKRPDGTEVRKFDAPKAVLMSYIIKGILDRQLPWALVLFGVMIALVLEVAGVPSLAFAVGVYLPISSSAPILAGGVVRWLVDSRLRREVEAGKMSEAELMAESDKSPGVLMASGYIAGGAIAGTLLAFYAGFFDRVEHKVTQWAEVNNPLFAGPYADALSLLPFLVLAAVLWWSGRRPVAVRA